jgi:hypothetical protein
MTFVVTLSGAKGLKTPPRWRFFAALRDDSGSHSVSPTELTIQSRNIKVGFSFKLSRLGGIYCDKFVYNR